LLITPITAREGKVGTLPERINGCLTRSLNGKPMPEGSAQMTAIIAYLRFLSLGSKVGTPISTRGPGPIQTMSRAADPRRGQDIYSAQCAACHGSDGQGQRVAPGDPTFAIPALWG
jgi:thiosulfate dehydrogenase